MALVRLFYLLLCLLLNTSGQLLNILGEILESYYDYREIVKGLFYHTGTDNPFSAGPADLIHSTLPGDAQRTLTLLEGFPNLLDHVFGGHLVEDPIAAHHNKVVLVFYEFERCYLRGCNHDFRIPAKALNFGMSITKGTGDREPTWQNSDRAQFGVQDFVRSDNLIVLI